MSWPGAGSPDALRDSTFLLPHAALVLVGFQSFCTVESSGSGPNPKLRNDHLCCCVLLSTVQSRRSRRCPTSRTCACLLRPKCSFIIASQGCG